MNMKMEEQQDNKEHEDREKRKQKKSKRKRSPREDGDNVGDESSVISTDEAPSEYESMLQKYEAEVRNHIKIEQQLKLHIECV